MVQNASFNHAHVGDFEGSRPSSPTAEFQTTFLDDQLDPSRSELVSLYDDFQPRTPLPLTPLIVPTPVTPQSPRSPLTPLTPAPPPKPKPLPMDKLETLYVLEHGRLNTKMDNLYKAIDSQSYTDHDGNQYDAMSTITEEEIKTADVKVETRDLPRLLREISDWRIQRVQQQNYSKKCYVPM